MGALCDICNGDMLVVAGCRPIPVSITKGDSILVVKEMEPIRYGQEQRFDLQMQVQFERDPEAAAVMREVAKDSKTKRCHDCGAQPGEFHHPGCDWEECPNCHHQMLMCGGTCG